MRVMEKQTHSDEAYTLSSVECTPKRWQDVMSAPCKEVAITHAFGVSWDSVLRAVDGLIAHNKEPIVHIAARNILEGSEFDTMLTSLAKRGVTQLCVVGGDRAASGYFANALELLETGACQDFTVTIAGHPQGIIGVCEHTLRDALILKSQYAQKIITQWCLNVDAVFAFVKTSPLPVRIGIMPNAPWPTLLQLAKRLNLPEVVHDVYVCMQQRTTCNHGFYKNHWQRLLGQKNMTCHRFFLIDSRASSGSA